MLPEWVERECNWMGRGSSAREEEELPGRVLCLVAPPASTSSTQLIRGVSRVFVYVCVFGGSRDSQDRLGH